MLFRKVLSRQGSLTLEAAVVFPFFLAVMLLLINFVKVSMVYVAMDHAVSETTKQIAAQAYPLKYLKSKENHEFLRNIQSQLIGKLLNSEPVKNVVQDKLIELYPLGKLHKEDFQITRLKLYDPNQGSKDIALVVEYQVTLQVPFFPPRVITLSNTAVERAWVDDSFGG